MHSAVVIWKICLINSMTVENSDEFRLLRVFYSVLFDTKSLLYAAISRYMLLCKPLNVQLCNDANITRSTFTNGIVDEKRKVENILEDARRRVRKLKKRRKSEKKNVLICTFYSNLLIPIDTDRRQ